MDLDRIVAAAKEMVVRPFLGEAAVVSDWLEGAAQGGPRAHFAPIAMFESLYETPADYNLTAWQRYEATYARFEQQRREIAEALTALWGEPQQYSFKAEYDRVLAGDNSVSSLEYDLAMFVGEQQVPAWSHEDRVFILLLGQMDKEFPVVLTAAVIKREGGRFPRQRSVRTC